MNTFYNDMLIRMGMPIDSAIGVKITVCDLNGILIEGHKGVITYTQSNVDLRLKGKKLSILGKNLSIMEITSDEVFIKGKLLSMAVEDV